MILACTVSFIIGAIVGFLFCLFIWGCANEEWKGWRAKQHWKDWKR